MPVIQLDIAKSPLWTSYPHPPRSELAALELGTINADDLRTALADPEPIWAELFPRERARVLALLLERVEFHGAAGDVVLAFRPGAPRGVAG